MGNHTHTRGERRLARHHNHDYHTEHHRWQGTQAPAKARSEAATATMASTGDDALNPLSRALTPWRASTIASGGQGRPRVMVMAQAAAMPATILHRRLSQKVCNSQTPIGIRKLSLRYGLTMCSARPSDRLESSLIQLRDSSVSRKGEHCQNRASAARSGVSVFSDGRHVYFTVSTHRA